MTKITISTFQLFEMFADQETAREYLEGRLWPDGPRCPVCGTGDAAPPSEPELEEELYQCACCGKLRPIDEIGEQYDPFGSQLICDVCIEDGSWPPEREYEKED